MDQPPSPSSRWNELRARANRLRPNRDQLRTVSSRARHPLWWLPDPAAKQDEAFRRIWQNLRALKEVEDGRRDTHRWRARNLPLAVCMVRVPRDVLGGELDDLRATLSQFPFVQLYPDDYLHVTIQEIAFIREDEGGRDEMTRARLDEFVSMADRALRDFPRFHVGLGPVNSFADAAFLDVYDDGWLSRIQARLMELMAVTPSTRYPYVPHLTIAEYVEPAPMGNLPAVLAEWRDRPLGEFVASSVDVVLLTSDGEAFPEQEVVYRFALGTTRATGAIPVRPDLSLSE